MCTVCVQCTRNAPIFSTLLVGGRPSAICWRTGRFCLPLHKQCWICRPGHRAVCALCIFACVKCWNVQLLQCVQNPDRQTDSTNASVKKGAVFRIQLMPARTVVWVIVMEMQARARTHTHTPMSCRKESNNGYIYRNTQIFQFTIVWFGRLFRPNIAAGIALRHCSEIHIFFKFNFKCQRQRIQRSLHVWMKRK